MRPLNFELMQYSMYTPKKLSTSTTIVEDKNQSIIIKLLNLTVNVTLTSDSASVELAN